MILHMSSVMHRCRKTIRLSWVENTYILQFKNECIGVFSVKLNNLLNELNSKYCESLK